MIKFLILATFCFTAAFGNEDPLRIENLEIIGGRNASVGEIPYQVSMEVLNRHHCGAVIISDEWIITAAHCANDVDASNTTIRAGTRIREHGGLRYKVESITVHPNYSIIEFDYDIALIHLQSKISFSKVVQKIPMNPKDSEVKAGVQATVSGWGYTNANIKIFSDTLLVTNVSTIDYKVCFDKYFLRHPITERMLCAGTEKDVGVCQGDSGGPLVVDGRLIGLVSWGAGSCANGEYPQVYSNIAKYRDYIKQVTGV